MEAVNYESSKQDPHFDTSAFGLSVVAWGVPA